MPHPRVLAHIGSSLAIAAGLTHALPSQAAGAKKASEPALNAAQPAAGAIDLAMYARIRDEGLAYSHAMQFATALSDGIGRG